MPNVHISVSCTACGKVVVVQCFNQFASLSCMEIDGRGHLVGVKGAASRVVFTQLFLC